jgi:hypothetical protein
MPTSGDSVDLTDVHRLTEQCTDAFRLETLPQYLVPGEDERFSAWKRGGRLRRTLKNNEWLAELKGLTAAGERWWRVRILDYPLVPYSAYELFGYQDSATAGQETFVADRAWHADLADLHEDFWIYDSATVVRMVYDEEGHFLRPELRNNVQHYLDIRDCALRHAVPLSAYLEKREPDLIAQPVDD